MSGDALRASVTLKLPLQPVSETFVNLFELVTPICSPPDQFVLFNFPLFLSAMGKSFIYYADSAFTVTYGKLRKHRNRNKCHDRIKNAVAVCDGVIVICIEK